MSHFIHKCTCGAIIAQCRCPAFNDNKHLTTIEKGCPKCHETLMLPKVTFDDASNRWRVEVQGGNVILISKEEWKLIDRAIHQHYHGED